MFRRATGFILMLCAFLLISASFLHWIPVTYAADFTVFADGAGIRITSGDPVYGMKNMAPGDSAEADLEINNSSDETYILAISADVEEGDRLLYEGLEITIEGVYSGPLSGLQEKRLGSFPAGTKQTFPMQVSLPLNAGNQYQDLAVTVQFQIMQLPEEPPPGPGDSDPPDDPNDDGNPDDDQDDDGDSNEDPDKPVLPVTGTNVNVMLPLGLVLFLVGLLLMSSAKKESENTSG